MLGRAILAAPRSVAGMGAAKMARPTSESPRGLRPSDLLGENSLPIDLKLASFALNRDWECLGAPLR